MLPKNNRIVHLNDKVSQPLQAGDSGSGGAAQAREPQGGWD